jgi:hypothetical protein
LYDDIQAIRQTIAQRSGARRHNKYGVAAPAARTIDGIVFDSKAEAARWCVLRAMERAGKIIDLERQVPYVLVKPYVRKDGTRCSGVRYIADFRYLEAGTNRIWVEDVKGRATDTYKVKRAMLEWLYPDMHFREVQAWEK